MAFRSSNQLQIVEGGRRSDYATGLQSSCKNIHWSLLGVELLHPYVLHVVLLPQ